MEFEWWCALVTAVAKGRVAVIGLLEEEVVKELKKALVNR